MARTWHGGDGTGRSADEIAEDNRKQEEANERARKKAEDDAADTNKR